MIQNKNDFINYLHVYQTKKKKKDRFGNLFFFPPSNLFFELLMLIKYLYFYVFSKISIKYLLVLLINYNTFYKNV